MRLAEMRGEALLEADALLGEAAHDVAKYMAITARNLDPGAQDPELRTALLKDLLRTDGERPAWEIWAPLRRRLGELAPDEALDRIDSGMKTLAAMARSDVDEGLFQDLVRTTVSVATEIASLWREVRRRRIEEAG
jgi:hypothetical protein